ncbi:MAG: IS110 family transposase [Arcobacteraceae bacterium]
MYSIGLDVSKSTINCFVPNGEIDLVIANNEKSLNQFLSKLKKIYKKDIKQIVFIFEPTGSYSTLLKRFCTKKSIKAFIVNPKQSHNFAKAVAQRNKSDEIDAQVLSKMIVIASENDIRVPIYDKNIEDIKDYMSYYKFIVKQLVQARNVLEAMNHNQSNKHIIKSLEKKIDAFQKESLEIIMKIKKIISQDQFLYQSFNNIKTIKGVGDISAIVLLHLFIKYPSANQRQIISLSGLEPTTKSSGSSVRIKPKISKAGSKLYRGTLFMSALTAIRFNPKITEFYNRLKDNGKQSTLAQVAVMRKLIIISHSLYKNNQKYICN